MGSTRRLHGRVVAREIGVGQTTFSLTVLEIPLESHAVEKHPHDQHHVLARHVKDDMRLLPGSAQAGRDLFRAAPEQQRFPILPAIMAMYCCSGKWGGKRMSLNLPRA